MLKLHRVRQHLKRVLTLLLADDATLTVSDVHRHLEHAHQLLQSMLPRMQRSQSVPWERWSVILFHYRREEVILQVQQAQGLLQHPVGPGGLQKAHQCLLQLHFRMLEVSGSSAG
ncbi:hypothetical protein [Deinococcus roseus]|uniref:Uncharacterized protein n=1 Tax=Deinococcus roseus TaxID=392414 RepID=A0ABQ2DGE1_9DEIO|nr:hypothetical protein [Deinococcus roseus]GGJ55373.1 hypothetical protein GCM10008938_46920 [Deinococcus roseus]